jgi:preprotein translocase subunit SecA
MRPSYMHSVPTPGVVHGVYPQRQASEANWLERAAANCGGLVRRSLPRSGYSEKRLLQRVNRWSTEFQQLGEGEISVRIARLRADLQRHGFEELSVAQTFALIRELAGRTLGMRHYDSQVIGGWLMLTGKVVELETGAGKTLTATLPACAAALAGLPVHIITVNDYLVRRDAEWMRPLYEALGISVGTITEGMESTLRQTAYRCAITYTTNKQLVFDYLRDRLTLGNIDSPLQMNLERLHGEQSKVRQLLLRGLCFAIVDEADSVLIDESRTPLIISKDVGAPDQERIYQQALDIAAQLEPHRHFALVARGRTVELTPEGERCASELAAPLGGIWRGHRRSVHLVAQALSARHAYIRDKHYLVKDGTVQIIDEFTGRTLADRSWEHGLHQMIEVKEGCPVTGQKETLARLSYQQFFRRYLHLAGMTGTAREVAHELWTVYRLQVATVPTQWAKKRMQLPTRIYRTEEQKWQAIVARIAELHRRERPVLVGTRSVAVSEHLSRLLLARKLPHRVLNARQDESEADIVRTAGERGSILVATNMAGRGTDIKLSPEVAHLGGLHVIATEIHEARRIDRQLFGRCARQADPGSYEMLLSLEDELVGLYCPWVWRPLHAGLRGLRLRTGAGLSWRLMRAAQRAAEREHSRQRYAMLKFDDQLKTLLAFSGTGG